jgi:hypothetical protein
LRERFYRELVCCGTHTALSTVEGDKLQATIELNHILGNKYLIVPSMDANSGAGWLAKAKQFNELADKLKGERMFTEALKKMGKA